MYYKDTVNTYNIFYRIIITIFFKIGTYIKNITMIYNYNNNILNV